MHWRLMDAKAAWKPDTSAMVDTAPRWKQFRQRAGSKVGAYCEEVSGRCARGGASLSSSRPLRRLCLNLGKAFFRPRPARAARQRLEGRTHVRCHLLGVSFPRSERRQGATADGACVYRIWQGRRVDALSDFIRNSMPRDDPGFLSDEMARDLVAYIVRRANNPGTPAGGKAGR